VIDQEMAHVVRELQCGDVERAMTVLDRLCRDRALRVAEKVVRSLHVSPALVEDAVQEGFARLFKYRDRLALDRSPVPFFLAIVRRAAIDLARRELRQRQVVRTAARAGVLGKPVPPRPVEDPVPELLRTLPEQGQELLLARYVRDLSAVEIAGEFSLPIPVVYRRLHQARTQVRARESAD
jgi:DNA-directed RNA polymerase specialized sigma24 family protein